MQANVDTITSDNEDQVSGNVHYYVHQNDGSENDLFGFHNLEAKLFTITKIYSSHTLAYELYIIIIQIDG